MDYKKTALAILDAVGGKENIVSAAHCATRLRLVIADNARCDKKTVENIDGVKGAFEASGQLQIIIGTGAVNKVYDEFVAAAGIAAASKEEVKQAAAAKAPWYKRAIKTLGDVFVPIIPAIVASGLLMGLTENGTYTIIHLFSNAAFVFLPILIGTSAAKVFGGNIYLGAVIGMIMIHTDLVNAWNVASAENIPTASVWFGLYDVKLVGYQGHVIPVIIAVWLMCALEKRLHKIVPEMIDLFVTPLVSVLVTGYLTLTVIGPVFGTVENYVLAAVQTLISLPFGLGSALCGAIYAPTVVAGVHHMYNALDAHCQLRQRGPGRRSTGLCPAHPGCQAQEHGAACLSQCVPRHYRTCHLRREPALLQALCGRYRGRLHRFPGRRLAACFLHGVRHHGCVRHPHHHPQPAPVPDQHCSRLCGGFPGNGCDLPRPEGGSSCLIGAKHCIWNRPAAG